MHAFVNVKKNQELLDGKFNFGQAVIRPNLTVALDNLQDDEVVMEFVFTDYNEVIEAVNAAHFGDTWEYFNIRWLHTYSKYIAGTYNGRL